MTTTTFDPGPTRTWQTVGHAAVEPFYDEYLAVRAEIEAAGRYPYNDSFRGRIPGIAGEHEDTGIYLLQQLHSTKDMLAKAAEFLEAGGVELDRSTLSETPTKFSRVARYGWYSGGTGFEIHEDVRLFLSPTGREGLDEGGHRPCLMMLRKGKRTNAEWLYGTVLVQR